MRSTREGDIRALSGVLLAAFAMLLGGAAEARCTPRTGGDFLFEPGRADCRAAVEDCSAFEEMLDDVVQRYDRWGRAGRIRLTGHSDTFASAEQSLLLSEQRAAFVRDQLVARGVPHDQIDIAGVGETQLRRPTADGVVEPQNNIVSVSLGDVLRGFAERGRDAYEAAMTRAIEEARAAGRPPPPPPPCPWFV